MCISSSNAKVFKCLCVGGGEGLEEGEECFELTYIIHYLSIIKSNSYQIVSYYSLHYPLCFTFVIVFLFIYHPLLIFYIIFCTVDMHANNGKNKTLEKATKG